MQGLPEHLTPRTDAGRAGLEALIARPGDALIALDYDGTLAPIVADPARAIPHPKALGVLGTLAARFGSIAIVTGRPAATAVELGGFAGAAGLGGLVVFGLYGAQRWDAATGTLSTTTGDGEDPHPGVAGARRELPVLLAELGPVAAGAWVEDKGASLAVHARAAQDAGLALAVLIDRLLGVADAHGLRLEVGRLVAELRAPGSDKGGALTAYAEERAASAVLYAGDDLGDLAAFAAVERLRARGVPGLAVAVASAEAETETRAAADAADLVVGEPEGLLALLAALADLAR